MFIILNDYPFKKENVNIGNKQQFYKVYRDMNMGGT